MASDLDLSKRSAWVEGEAEAQQLIFDLAEKIVTTDIPHYDPVSKVETLVPSNWEEVYRAESEKWVTYKPMTTPNVVGKYKHTDGKLYTVYKMPNMTGYELHSGAPAVDGEGYLYEMEIGNRGTNNPGAGGTYGNVKTGKKIQVVQISHTDSDGNTVFIDVPGILVVLVEDLTIPTGYRSYVVKQVMTTLDGTKIDSTDWNEFEIVTELPGDWHYALYKMVYDSKGFCYQWAQVWVDRTYDADYWATIDDEYARINPFTFGERYYVANPTHYVDSKVVLKATPDVPEGIPSRDYFVMLTQPISNFNYFDVQHGVGFEGSTSIGDPSLTYKGICDESTVRPDDIPVIIDQTKAHFMYLEWNDPLLEKVYTPPVLKWQIDYDGVTEMVSPPAHFHHGRDSVTPWLPNKKRRPDYLVGYKFALNNDRIAIVLEGDPSPDIHGYYRSFGYIGKIVPFNEYDHMGNFGITVGMGDLQTQMTGFVANDIRVDKNTAMYAGYGEYTSNGMSSMSMYRTRSNVLFQAYYPAFITQLPNYPSVGTIPPQLSKLFIDKNGFQKSSWTDRYHASPIYMVHVSEGYRGFLDGVVAIHDHNLVTNDELLVDTEVLKDPDIPSMGTWTEVYKFFSIKSPINLFKHSPSPDVVTVAILKEIK